MLRILGLVLLLICLPASADVYRCQRGNGTATYTDKPCHKGDKPADLPDINVVKTPRPKTGDKALARQWDERLEREKKARDKADAAWVKEYDDKQTKEERVRSGRLNRKVVAGMTPEQVREVLGEPDSILTQEGRENIIVWSYKPRQGPQHTISFRAGEVNSVSSRSSKSKKKS